MPTAPLKPCAHPTCPELVVRGRCPAHTKEKRARLDEDTYRREAHAFYKSKAWREGTRPVVLARDPVCVRCRRRESTIGAHKEPYTLRWCMENNRLDLALDPKYVEGCCAPCHNRESGQQARARQLADKSELKCQPKSRVETSKWSL